MAFSNSQGVKRVEETQMKRILKMIGFCLLAQCAGMPAEAATPYVSGPYGIHLTGLCQSVEIEWVPSGNRSRITGDFQQSIGAINFKPATSGARKGSFTLKLTGVGGWINNQTWSDTWQYPTGSRFTQKTEQGSGTYTMTSTTMTLKLGSDTQAYIAYFNKVSSSGVIQDASFVRLIKGTPAGAEPTTPDCSQDGTITHK
jgi:hypothetical protein